MKKLFVLFTFACFIVNILFATNPDITKNLVNLSKGIPHAGYDDFLPEMIIEGNTIHAVWTSYVSGDEAYLYYSRSTDLGENWENPKSIYQYKEGARAKQESSQRLAVSGEKVYIAISDYDYGNNGTGYIYLLKSENNGESFSQAVELANSGGGYSALKTSFVKTKNGKVVIVYRQANYNDATMGLYCLFSNNGGDSFESTKFDEESKSISDLWYDGNQIVIVHHYVYYFYGLNTGRVYVSVSNDNGASFITNKVSVQYQDGEDTRERCTCSHDNRYVPKVEKDGNNIHVVFTGYNESGVWTVFYVRSSNNGASFEKAIDVNKGVVAENKIQAGQETITAFGGYVYLAYLSNNSKPFLVRSADSGQSLSEPQSLMTPETHYIETSWWPQLVIDKSDESGKTVFFGGSAMMTRKSTDGGETFKNTKFLAPILKSGSDVNTSVLRIDDNGKAHWLSKARWYWSFDFDIFYGKEKEQAQPGSENKALSIETIYNNKWDLTIVPSSESIEFDSVMTGEAWVKFAPGNEDYVNIFAKVNGYDGHDYQPSGYNIGFRDNNGAMCINTGIETDKGQYINWGGCQLNDTLWHHIAFTYDARSGLNNFKTYLDGLLNVESTVTGEIIPGDGLFMIGSRNGFIGTSKYYVDDIRLWDRALSQEELISNQTKTLNGNEEGLKLWLNFDDTFKDISGNGNDAIPLNLGDLQTSEFNPPLTDFEKFQSANTVAFSNKTKNGTNYFWDFGDEETSENGHPKHTFTTSGEYNVSLLGKNENSVTSAIDHVSIVGLDRIEPNSAGNIGETILTIYGGGLQSNMKVSLLLDDNEIIADTVVGTGEDGFIQALFLFTDEETGLYDLVVNEMTIEDAFTLEQAEGTVQPWVDVSGRSTVLLNRWTKYKITYGNNGDVDALMVPISFAVPDIEGLKVDFVDFKFVLPDVVVENNGEEAFLPFKDFYVTDVLWGKPQRSRVYSFIIPRIKANSSDALHFLVKSSESYKITSWASDPWVKYENSENSSKSAALTNEKGAKLAVAECITEAIGVTLLETSVSVIPYAGALYNSAKTGYTAGDLYYEKDKVKAVRNTALQGATTFFSYVSVVPIVGWVAGTVGGLVCGGISSYYAVSDCMNKGTNEKGVSTVSSLDPNEMIGPDGFGNKGWIQKRNEIPYTVLFENKKEATAPAHDVFIRDTLDLAVFDVSNFGFGSFGWGDTLFTPPGENLKEFTMDIDLRPDINIITRVSGKLEEQSGLVSWEFLSLNPETMDLEEDPFAGFLPPNNTSPEGEGFVSFTIGLKEELGTNAEIRNKASIVFDANEPIVTNEYVNTLDLDKPESKVAMLSETIDSHFPVTWSGSDKGSGIRAYNIYVLENDTLLHTWLMNTSETTDEFIGDVGSKYKFYSIAVDNVSLAELAPDGYDASTHITVDVEAFDALKEELTVFPNPVSNNLNLKLANAPCGVYVLEIINVNGSVNHSQIYNEFDLQNGINIDVSNYQKGQYVAKIVCGNKSISRKFLVY